MSSVLSPYLVTKCSWISSTAPSAWKGHQVLAVLAVLAVLVAAVLDKNALFVAAVVNVQVVRLVSVVMALAYVAIAMAKVLPLTMALNRIVTCAVDLGNVTGAMEQASVPHVVEKAIINISFINYLNIYDYEENELEEPWMAHDVPLRT